jgi:hypothetical protein
MQERGRRAGLLQIAGHPPFAFLRNYLLRGGIRDGVPGLIISTLNAYYVFLKFSKLWHFQHSTGAPQLSTGAAEHSAGSVEHSAGSAEHAAGSAEHAAGSAEHSAGSVEHSAGSVEHSAGSAQHPRSPR